MANTEIEGNQKIFDNLQKIVKKINDGGGFLTVAKLGDKIRASSPNKGDINKFLDEINMYK
jgi:hypothetical protein